MYYTHTQSTKIFVRKVINNNIGTDIKTNFEATNNIKTYDF